MVKIRPGGWQISWEGFCLCTHSWETQILWSRRGLKMARVGIWRSHKNACHLYASLLASWCLYVYGIGICVNFLKHACCWFLEWLPIFAREPQSFVCSLILVEACANHPMCVRTRNLAYTPPVTNSEHAWAWKRSAGAARMVMMLCATVAAKVFLLEWYFINLYQSKLLLARS